MLDDKSVEAAYKPGITSLRDLAKLFGTDHHAIKRCLLSIGIEIVRAKPKPLSKERKRRISNTMKGRTGKKGVSATLESKYKNMCAHLRFSVELSWLMSFEDFNKLKTLNGMITSRGDRYRISDETYKKYIEKFYCDQKFNNIYEKWVLYNYDKYLKPSIDHINPKSRGGLHDDVDNWQVMSWLENRCKHSMTKVEWDNIKHNIDVYFDMNCTSEITE